MSNEALLARRAAAVPRGVATALPIFAARAENAELWDVEGRQYVDFAGGIGVLNVGHRHPEVMAAATAQAALFTHTAFQVVGYEPYIALAERLNALAPISQPAKTIFFTTGAEATENAVKIARVQTGRSGVIAFVGGFHGRTLLASAMTGKVLPYKRALGRLPGDVFHCPFPSELHGVRPEESMMALERIFAADIAPEEVAAIIIEPVQGEGGFHTAPASFLADLRALCDRHGILLIADEVQAGIARTGRMFAIEHSGVEPDLIAVAKSLAGGFPLSGVIGKADIMDAVEPGGLGGTYAGSPIACAAALAVLDIVEREGLLGRATYVGDRVKARLRAIAGRPDTLPISGIRGLGAMVAFDIVKFRGGRDVDGAAAKRVSMVARDKGLIVLTCGAHGEALRILVPLTISDELLDEGMDRLEATLAEAAR